MVKSMWQLVIVGSEHPRDRVHCGLGPGCYAKRSPLRHGLRQIPACWSSDDLGGYAGRVSLWRRLCPPSRSFASSSSAHIYGSKMYASLFLAFRESCSCGSGGDGTRSTHLGGSKRSFSVRSPVFRSPVSWAVLIMDSAYMTMDRKSAKKDFGMCHSPTHRLTPPTHPLTHSLTVSLSHCLSVSPSLCLLLH